MVTIKVGPEEREFHVHKLFLIEASTFFQSAFEGNFREATENEIKMPEESAEVFEHFIRWLYTYCDCATENKPTTDSIAIRAAKIKRIIDLYVFGDKVGCRALQQDMIREFFLPLGTRPFFFPYGSVEYLYSQSITAEPLREMTVAFHVWFVEPHLYKTEQNLQELLASSPEFAKEVLVEMGGKYGQIGATNPLNKGVDYFLAKV